jgi:allantoinase
MAAAAGGVTTILDMPLNDLPPTTNRERLERKREMIGGESIIDYGLWGGLIDNNLDDLEGLHAGGVIAFKAFMRTVADFRRVDDGLLYDGLLRIANLERFR